MCQSLLHVQTWQSWGLLQARIYKGSDFSCVGVLLESFWASFWESMNRSLPTFECRKRWASSASRTPVRPKAILAHCTSALCRSMRLGDSLWWLQAANSKLDELLVFFELSTQEQSHQCSRAIGQRTKVLPRAHGHLHEAAKEQGWSFLVSKQVGSKTAAQCFARWFEPTRPSKFKRWRRRAKHIFGKRNARKPFSINNLG